MADLKRERLKKGRGPIGLAGKEYPDFEISDAFLTLIRLSHNTQFVLSGSL